MISQVLRASRPELLALIAVAFAGVAVVRIGRGGSGNLSGSIFQRLRGLPADERGAVQSLSLVMTLPVFLMLLLLSIQISELMIGTMFVHYAAYAAARSAIVWIPARTDLGENHLSGAAPGTPLRIDAALIDAARAQQQAIHKHEEILTAAVVACLPIAPSKRRSNASVLSPPTALVGALQRQYPLFDPGSQNNRRMSGRLADKVIDSWNHTTVSLRYEDRNSASGPTYNPQDHPRVFPYNPAVVGWQDPVTITVVYDLALLPGVGRMLSLANNVRRSDGYYRKPVSAAVTLSNCGLISLQMPTSP